MVRAVVAGVFMIWGAPASAQHADVMRIGDQPAATAIISLDDDPPEPWPAADAPVMLLQLEGHLGSLDRAALTRLKAAISTKESNIPSGDVAAPRIGAGERIAFTIHLRTKDGAEKRLQVIEVPDGTSAMVELLHDGVFGQRVRLKSVPFGAFVAALPPFRGEFDAPTTEAEVGKVTRLAAPYTPSSIILDEKAINDRLGAGGRTRLVGTTRLLSEEAFFVRLPKAYDPATPAGLVIWIDPGTSGEPPESFYESADALNLILAGAANSGNSRALVDRIQLVLDEIATVSRRFHVDQERIYVSGLSGGGRVSSIMAACFADLLAGAAPICGLSGYSSVPVGNGTSWRAAYRKPRGEVWARFAGHRMAAVTGTNDFNRANTRAVATVMEIDGVPIRVFDLPGLAHQIPDSAQMTEVMTWLDELVRNRIQAHVEASDGALREINEQLPLGKADGKRIARLKMLMGEHPWTPAAHKAAAELLAPGASSTPTPAGLPATAPSRTTPAG